MSSGESRPFVSVKFTPAGRTYSFLLPEFDLDGVGAEAAASGPAFGEQVIVDTPDGTGDRHGHAQRGGPGRTAGARRPIRPRRSCAARRTRTW